MAGILMILCFAFGVFLGMYIKKYCSFGRKDKEIPQENAVPNIGEEWYYTMPDGSPFEQKKYHPVTITGINDGWVKYDMGWPFRDERLPLKEFIRMYEKHGLK